MQNEHQTIEANINLKETESEQLRQEIENIESEIQTARKEMVTGAIFGGILGALLLPISFGGAAFGGAVLAARNVKNGHTRIN